MTILSDMKIIVKYAYSQNGFTLIYEEFGISANVETLEGALYAIIPIMKEAANARKATCHLNCELCNNMPHCKIKTIMILNMSENDLMQKIILQQA